MSERVVPYLDGDRITNEKVDEFRASVLSSRIWRTSIGQGVLRWFWKSWLGRWLTRKFADAKASEIHGYAYWGPVAVAITVVEILGALSERFRDAFPWPTISSTVGHAQDINSLWGLAVVIVIAAAAFYAVSYVGEAAPPGTQPLFQLGWFRIRYGWPLVYIVTAAIALAVWFLVSRDEFHLGYAIYGSFAIVGIVVPMLLVWRKSKRVVFPNVFFTFRKLRERFRWAAFAVIAGLSILILHLALYPWPNLAREPAKYAGVNAYHARIKAEDAIKDALDAKPDLVYSTQGRGISNGVNTWFVYFNTVTGQASTHTGCVIEVTSKTASLTSACRNE